jgi:hypothetical protein
MRSSTTFLGYLLINALNEVSGSGELITDAYTPEERITAMAAARIIVVFIGFCF